MTGQFAVLRVAGSLLGAVEMHGMEFDRSSCQGRPSSAILALDEAGRNQDVRVAHEQCVTPFRFLARSRCG